MSDDVVIRMEREIIERLNKMLETSGSEPHRFPLSRTQCEDFLYFLMDCPALYVAYINTCDDAAAVRDARAEFQRDRSIKLEKRAVNAVRQLGWMNTKKAVHLRGKSLLTSYWALTHNHSRPVRPPGVLGPPRPVCLPPWMGGSLPGAICIANKDVHPGFSPNKRFIPVPDPPLDGEAAINLLAECYETTPGSMRKWLKNARATAKKEIGERDSDSPRTILHIILTAKLPESGDR